MTVSLLSKYTYIYIYIFKSLWNRIKHIRLVSIHWNPYSYWSFLVSGLSSTEEFRYIYSFLLYPYCFNFLFFCKILWFLLKFCDIPWTLLSLSHSYSCYFFMSCTLLLACGKTLGNGFYMFCAYASGVLSPSAGMLFCFFY